MIAIMCAEIIFINYLALPFKIMGGAKVFSWLKCGAYNFTIGY